MAHIWMQHTENGNYAELPDLPFWRSAGWEPADAPPPEPDYTRDPLPNTQPAEENTETPPSAGSSAVRPKARADKAASTVEEK